MRYKMPMTQSIRRRIVMWGDSMRFDDQVCPRCAGLFVRDYLRDGLQMWSCVNCGCKMDDTIWFHQQISKPESLSARRDRLEREWQQACLMTMPVTVPPVS